MSETTRTEQLQRREEDDSIQVRNQEMDMKPQSDEASRAFAYPGRKPVGCAVELSSNPGHESTTRYRGPALRCSSGEGQTHASPESAGPSVFGGEGPTWRVQFSRRYEAIQCNFVLSNPVRQGRSPVCATA